MIVDSQNNQTHRREHFCSCTSFKNLQEEIIGTAMVSLLENVWIKLLKICDLTAQLLIKKFSDVRILGTASQRKLYIQGIGS